MSSNRGYRKVDRKSSSPTVIVAIRSAELYMLSKPVRREEGSKLSHVIYREKLQLFFGVNKKSVKVVSNFL